ncbi:MAG: transglycosylase SLT domain-containing protein [Alloprevotella sp.]|nr:transglycosylase SLT domain-containing protein [Alloprevotella sp.]
MKQIKTLFLSLLAVGTSATVQAQNEITIHDERFGQDEVFTLPEGMVISEDSLLSDWQERNYLYPDTTCENPNYNPTYGPEVYRDRLLRLPTVIEMTYNDIVQRFIDQYCNHGRRGVASMLGKSNLYVPIFEEALDYYGLPLELKYLPVIESALNPNAVSPAGAAGLWQMIVSTGKQYDLEINSRVDERRDPVKSTWAAARLLRDLFKIYGDWHLVLAAYNCGPGNVNKAIHRADGQRDYWKIYPYLPKETRGYVPAFIAANYVMNYYCDHNICPMRTRYPIATDTILLSRNVDMRQVAKLCDVDLDIIKALNPQYRTDIVPGYSAPYTLRLPQEAVGTFIALKDTIYGDSGERFLRDNYSQDLTQGSAFAANGDKPTMPQVSSTPVRHVADAAPVRTTTHTTTTTTTTRTTTTRTETPASSRHTSRHQQTTQQTAHNGRYGKNARNNVASTKNTASTKNARNSKNAKNNTAKGKGKGKQRTQETTVQNGQTLTQIARKHGTTVAELKRLNNLKGDVIRSGRKLRVK